LFAIQRGMPCPKPVGHGATFRVWHHVERVFLRFSCGTLHVESIKLRRNRQCCDNSCFWWCLRESSLFCTSTNWSKCGQLDILGSDTVLFAKLASGMTLSLPVHVSLVSSGMLSEAVSYCAPVISSQAQSNMMVRDGRVVVLAGQHFGAAAYSLAVRFGASSCSWSVWTSDSSGTCRTSTSTKVHCCSQSWSSSLVNRQRVMELEPGTSQAYFF
jgi:hypothetical protein